MVALWYIECEEERVYQGNQFEGYFTVRRRTTGSFNWGSCKRDNVSDLN